MILYFSIIPTGHELDAKSTEICSLPLSVTMPAIDLASPGLTTTKAPTLCCVICKTFKVPKGRLFIFDA